MSEINVRENLEMNSTNDISKMDTTVLEDFDEIKLDKTDADYFADVDGGFTDNHISLSDIFGGNENMENKSTNLMEKEVETEKAWGEVLKRAKEETPKHDDISEPTKISTSFIQARRVDSDSAYERIKILKSTKAGLKNAINNTDCTGMSSELIEIYNCIANCIDDAISWESYGVAAGDQYE